jgi:uncharacterized protein (DUF983 family)
MEGMYCPYCGTVFNVSLDERRTCARCGKALPADLGDNGKIKYIKKMYVLISAIFVFKHVVFVKL